MDLEKCEVWDEAGFRASFVVHHDPETHAFRRQTLLTGQDEIALTLQAEDEITAFEGDRPGWLTPAGR